MAIRQTVVDSQVFTWQRISSTVVHACSQLEVRSDRVIQPDDARGEYVHVVAPASVTVLAMRDDDQVVLARQWVYPHSGTEWRLPGGVVDASDGSPEQAARRELAAFTGLQAERWEQIGLIHGADSLSNHVDHLYLARGLTEGPPPSAAASLVAHSRCRFGMSSTLCGTATSRTPAVRTQYS